MMEDSKQIDVRWLRVCVTCLLLVTSSGILWAAGSVDQRQPRVEKVVDGSSSDTLTYLKIKPTNSALNQVMLYASNAWYGNQQLVELERFVKRKGILLVGKSGSDNMTISSWVCLASSNAQVLSDLIWACIRTNKPDSAVRWSYVTDFDVAVSRSNYEYPFVPERNLRSTAGLGEEQHSLLHYFRQVHSSSTLNVSNEIKRPQIRITYKASGSVLPEFSSKEVVTWSVLARMLTLPTSTFKQRLVETGLTLEAGLNRPDHRGLPCFVMYPNPYGIKASLDTFFAEVYRMHRFDYSTVEQLELAKQIIINERSLRSDRFETLALDAVDFFASGNMDAYWEYEKILESITKVDLLNLIKKHIQNRPFHLEVRTPEHLYERITPYVSNSLDVDSLILQFEKGKTKLDHDREKELKELAYVLNLSPKGTITIVTSDRKKRLALKRADEVTKWFGFKKLRMEYRIKYKKIAKGETPTITFEYERSK